MAGKSSRKKANKANKAKSSELYLERFACDILSYTLPLCGLPKEKLKSKKRNKINYEDCNHVFNVTVIVIHVALSMRDEWKTMFESRLNSSGLDNIEKIDEYLKSFLQISREFRNGNTLTKIKVSLAAYSEMILFINYKGIEFDFEKMIILWSIHFMELITPQQKASESLQNLFQLPHDPSEYIKWVTSFLKDDAIPYGHSENVSKVFLDKLKQKEGERNLTMSKILAHPSLQTTNTASAGEPDPVLPPGFESLAVLPGDRESPEPSEVCSSKSDVRGKEKEFRRRSAKPVVSPGFESLAVLPGGRESPDPPEWCTTKSGVHEKDKESRRRSARPVSLPGFESLTVLPGDRESPEPPEGCSTKSGVRGKDKESRRRSAPSTHNTAGRRKPSTKQGREASRLQTSLSSPQEIKSKD